MLCVSHCCHILKINGIMYCSFYYKIWLPPTPPAESTDDVYVDLVLDIAYDTSTTISPAELAFIAPFR